MCAPVAECLLSLADKKLDTLQWLLILFVHPKFTCISVSKKCFCSNFWWLILQRKQRKCCFWGLIMGIRGLYHAKEFTAQLPDSWHGTNLFYSMTWNLHSEGTLLYLSHKQKRAQCFLQEFALGHSISIRLRSKLIHYLSHFGTESLGFARFSIDFFLQGLPPHLACRKITYAA